MTLPSLAWATVCALLLGSLFHLLVDGGPARLLLYLFLSAAGFAAGQWLATSQNWVFLPVGPIQLGFGALGSALLMVVGNWLSNVKISTTGRDGTV